VTNKSDQWVGQMSYDANSIEVLEGLEAVRHRPGMYIGSTDSVGYHHLLWEIVDNSIDEAIAGFADAIDVELGPTWAQVTDNGRGIPHDKHAKTGKNALDVIFTTLHSGGKFSGDSYKTSGGLHGVGSSVVNALSSELQVSSTRSGKTVTRRFERGKVTGRLSTAKAPKRAHGSSVQFSPDQEIFGDIEFDKETVLHRLRIKSFLTPNVSFRLIVDKEETVFLCENGLLDFLDYELQTNNLSSITGQGFQISSESPSVHIALAWVDEPAGLLKSFANGIPTRDGGTHVHGLKDGVVKAVRKFAKDFELNEKKLPLTAEDIREGLVALCSIFVENPQFQGQTKDRLNNPEVRQMVEHQVRKGLQDILYNNRNIGELIVQRAKLAARARLASRSAIAAVQRKTPMNRLALPGKLSDCSSRNPDECELFLVEGDSAGGSAKQGRDRHNQAILALRGKVLNTESVTIKRVMENEELKNIVLALGCGIGSSFDESKLRYSKVILLMDADVDGHHISTLLMTFFYRFLPQLISSGRLYLAQPPLYRVAFGTKTEWLLTDEALDSLIAALPKRVNPEITRFKGLGEMPAKTLYNTTLNPDNRQLLRVTIPDDCALITEETISALMGKDPTMRADMIRASHLSDEVTIDV